MVAPLKTDALVPPTREDLRLRLVKDFPATLEEGQSLVKENPATLSGPAQRKQARFIEARGLFNALRQDGSISAQLNTNQKELAALYGELLTK